MKEDGPCLVMDPLSLETEGFTFFDGKLKNQTFSAHGKIDPVTGNFCNFGYAATGLLTRDCSFFEIDPQGNVLYETFFEAPYYCMMHDYAITEHYAVFHIVPSTGNWDRLKAGLPHFGSTPHCRSILAYCPAAPALRAKTSAGSRHQRRSLPAM
jgi:carotenoid cleavage dioxygenase